MLSPPTCLGVAFLNILLSSFWEANLDSGPPLTSVRSSIGTTQQGRNLNLLKNHADNIHFNAVWFLVKSLITKLRREYLANVDATFACRNFRSLLIRNVQLNISPGPGLLNFFLQKTKQLTSLSSCIIFNKRLESYYFSYLRKNVVIFSTPSSRSRRTNRPS